MSGLLVSYLLYLLSFCLIFLASRSCNKGTEGSKEVQGLHFPHLALAFPVACYRLVTNFQETNRQQETHARRDERTVIPKSISFAASPTARPLVLGAGPRTQGNLNSPSKGNFSVPPGGSLSWGTLLLSPLPEGPFRRPRLRRCRS